MKLDRIKNGNGWSQWLVSYICFDNDKLRNIIEYKYPLFKDVVNVLGQRKCNALKFRRKEILNELNVTCQLKDNGDLIKQLLGLEIGKFYSSKELKEKLQLIYKQLGINYKAKGNDILKWYNVVDRISTIKKIRVRGYVIKE